MIATTVPLGDESPIAIAIALPKVFDALLKHLGGRSALLLTAERRPAGAGGPVSATAGRAQTLLHPHQALNGAPATGLDPVMAIRLPDELTEAVEQWAAGKKVTRSQAIRMLIDKKL